MISISSFFDKIFVINLLERPERWENIKNELQKAGITNYERLDAFKVNHLKLPESYYSRMQPNTDTLNIDRYLSGSCGCKLSHLKAVSTGIERGYHNILILEDDVQFIDKASEVLEKTIAKLPHDWEMLYLGGNHLTPPTWCGWKLKKIQRSFTSHAYGVNLKTVGKKILEARECGTEIDVFYAKSVQPRRKCYLSHPSIAFQRPGHSDILGIKTDYSGLIT